jgi:hypothetical protein
LGLQVQWLQAHCSKPRSCWAYLIKTPESLEFHRQKFNEQFLS